MLNLSNIDIDDFLQNYWQKKPLLIRSALPNFTDPLSPEELAGLACEPDIESRIVIETKGNWKLKTGPFNEQNFLDLPPDHWTLLVQAVNHFVPHVAELLNYFRFIPNWRVDDVMVSFASRGGSVGPHQDAYDVFLLQGLGKRQWQVGSLCNGQEKLQDNDDLQLLANFQALQQWTLQAGDILYLPPGYGHWGISTDDQCMTYSIGFRAPSHAQIWSSFCDFQIDQIDNNLRYCDPLLKRQHNPGEISETAIQQIQAILTEKVQDKEQIKQWFGRFVTEAKYPSADSMACHDSICDRLDFNTIKAQLLEQGQLLRSADIRFAFTRTLTGGILFANSQAYECSKQTLPLIELIASGDNLSSKDVLKFLDHPESKQLLTTLFNNGYIYCDEQFFD